MGYRPAADPTLAAKSAAENNRVGSKYSAEPKLPLAVRVMLFWESASRPMHASSRRVPGTFGAEHRGPDFRLTAEIRQGILETIPSTRTGEPHELRPAALATVVGVSGRLGQPRWGCSPGALTVRASQAGHRPFIVRLSKNVLASRPAVADRRFRKRPPPCSTSKNCRAKIARPIQHSNNRHWGVVRRLRFVGRCDVDVTEARYLRCSRCADPTVDRWPNIR